MSEFVIPCDTYVRLANVLHSIDDNVSDWFRTIRIENGIAIATNRKIMVMENIDENRGVFHLLIDPKLIEQCRTETPFDSKLTIVVNDMLKFASAKTTLGYVHADNCGYFSDEPNEFGNWHDVIKRVLSPATGSVNGMFWDADDIARMAASSPSGKIVFEQFIDATNRPTIIRDIYEHNWCGIFNPFNSKENYAAATLPTWLSAAS